MSQKPERSRLELLREMHEKNPLDGFVAYGLAMELAKSPATEGDAVRAFHDLCARTPDYLPAYLQLGMLHSRRGEIEEAKKAYREGMALATRLGDRHTLGELEGALGNCS